jgi:alcohol dehydrogenase class IV
MRSFQHVEPALRLFHGEESLGMLGRELERLGSTRAVIVCGGTVAGDARSMALLGAALNGRSAGLFDGVRAHSPVASVDECARALARWEADAVVAVGGGSAIVTARAASILLAEGRGAHALCTRRGTDGRIDSPRLLAPKLPQLVVPTTPTTACVKAGSAVFDPEVGERLALFDPKTRAKAVFIHPYMALSAPPALVMSAGLNVLAMAVEGLESASGEPLSDAVLMHAVRLLAANLPRLAGPTDNAAVRSELMLAAILCGQGTDHAGGGLASVLGHAIGARFRVDNGLANAIVLPHTMRFNELHTVESSGKVVAALSAPDSTAVDAVGQLLASLNGPLRLRDIGVPREFLPSIARAAIDDWFLRSNPRPVEGVADLITLLEGAW